MTIEKYRQKAAEGNMPLPKNGAGFYVPQLIDDLWEAREHLIAIRTKSQYTFFQSANLTDAIGYLNRCLKNLGIDLK